MEGDMQRIRRDQVSEIDDLPSDVMDKIVSSLELHEAVRASAVAKAWRHCWKVKRELIFDEEFYNKFINGTHFRYDTVVNSTIAHHVSTVSMFGIEVPRDFPINIRVNICHGISILSHKEVEEFEIDIHNSHTRPYLQLPPEFCNFSKLSSLDLTHCQLKRGTSEFNGFSNLRSLKLSDVRFPDKILNLMISSSAHLYELELEFYRNGRPVEIRHPASENLRSLYFTCKEECTRPLRLLSFPNLVQATIETVLELPGLPMWNSKLEYFSTLVPRVKNLGLGGSALASLADEIVSFDLPSPLQCVNELILYDFDIASAEQLNVAFCFIRSSPKLQTIIIEVLDSDEDNDAARAALEDQQSLDPLTHIKDLIIENLMNTNGVQLDFIETICELFPNVNEIYIKSECLEREVIEDLNNMLRSIQLSEGQHIVVEWNRGGSFQLD